MSSELCMWCLERVGNSREHILAECLGGTDDFVLHQGVCEDCNRKNGKLDRQLLKPFELATVMKSIPRKKGKRPTVDGHSTFASGYDENGPVFHFNREKYSVQIPSGKRLSGSSKQDVIQDFSFVPQDDGQVRVSFKQRLLFDRGAVRGLFKTALETIAFYNGLETVRQPNYNGIRRFVLNDEGSYGGLITAGGPFDRYLTSYWTAFDGGIVVPMTILEIGFILDFDPDFTNGKRLKAMGMLMDEPMRTIPNWPPIA